MESYFIPVYIFGLFVFIILWIWALLDLTSSRFKKAKWKWAWLLIIIFFPFVGSLLYLLLRKDFKAQKRRGFNPQFGSGRRINK